MNHRVTRPAKHSALDLTTPPDIKALKPFDAAPEALVTPTVLVHGQAMMQRIVASDQIVVVSHPGRIAPRPTSKTAFAIRVVALPVCAALIVGGIALATLWSPGLPSSDSQVADPQLSDPQLADPQLADPPSSDLPLADPQLPGYHALPPLIANFASWTPTPQTIVGTELYAIQTTCWAELERSQAETLALFEDDELLAAYFAGPEPVPNLPEWNRESPDFLAGFEFVGAEARGDWGAAFWRNTNNDIAYCLTYTDPTSDQLQIFTWNVTYETGGWVGIISERNLNPWDRDDTLRIWRAAARIWQPDQVMLMIEQGTVPERGEPFNVAVGVTGSDVTEVRLTTADDQVIDATIADGVFFAWWPGQIMPQQPFSWYPHQGQVMTESAIRCDLPNPHVSPDDPQFETELTTLMELLLVANPAWTEDGTGAWICDFEMPQISDAERQITRNLATTKLTGVLADGTAEDWGIPVWLQRQPMRYQPVTEPEPNMVAMRTTLTLNPPGGWGWDTLPVAD